jgi:hypothetical protein
MCAGLLGGARRALAKWFDSGCSVNGFRGVQHDTLGLTLEETGDEPIGQI